MILVYSTDISIAFKDKLGLYKIKNITLFDLHTLSQLFPITDFKMQDKEVNFSVKCPICDNNHLYRYTINEFIKKEMIIGGCEDIGKPIFVFGNQFKVLRFIDRYNEINKKIYAMLQ